MIRRDFSLRGAYLVFGTCLLGACTTVDLSQVSLENSKTVTQSTPSYNVVEKASMKMTALFVNKGWCKNSSVHPTQTAASVLLNGKDSTDAKPDQVNVVGSRQLSADLNLAELHISQTTKAAEIYLTTADELSELSNELSLLETALLAAKEAEGNFGETIKFSASQINRDELKILSQSIGQLKQVTDAYGDRMRGQIAQKSNPNRS